MKRIETILILCLTLALGHNLSAQQSSGMPSEIIAGISQGNVARLTPYLGVNVELIIGSKNDVYSKQQAIEIISDFFKRNTVINFQILHSGAKDMSNFAIGTLKTSTGTYRVYILTRKVDGKPVIQQLRIESSNE